MLPVYPPPLLASLPPAPFVLGQWNRRKEIAVLVKHWERQISFILGKGEMTERTPIFFVSSFTIGLSFSLCLSSDHDTAYTMSDSPP